MIKNNIFKAIKRKDILVNKNLISNTWAMKKKASSRFRARINAHGFEQVNGIHFLSTNTLSSTVNDMSIKIILV